MSWKRICNIGDVPENTVKEFNVGAFSVVVINYGEGFRVLPPVCPHMEEPLEQSGIVANCQMTCSKHLWAWNLRDLSMAGTETCKDLQPYASKVEGDQVLAQLDTEIVYEFEDEDELDDEAFFKQA